MDMNRLRTNWIWLPNWIPENDSDARIVYFRKEMMVDDALPAKKAIKITADSRYKLYINGKFVQEGPQKPLDQKEWFVDTANAAPYLVPGANVVAIEVLRFAASQNDSLYRTNTPCLYIEDCTADNPSFAGKKRLEMHHNTFSRILHRIILLILFRLLLDIQVKMPVPAYVSFLPAESHEVQDHCFLLLR